MAFESDSLTRRTVGPALAAAVVGIAVGAVAVFGVAAVSQNNSIPEGSQVSADDALLGGPEYGSRG